MEDPASDYPQCLDDSVLVEDDDTQSVSSKEEKDAGHLFQLGTGSTQAAVLGSHVAVPSLVLQNVQSYLHPPGPIY